MTSAIAAPTLITGLTDDETRTIDRLLDALKRHSRANWMARAYYEARQITRHMGIAIPAEVTAKILPVVGWGGTVVDVIEERLEWLGWRTLNGVDLGLSDVFAANKLAVEAGFAHLDALMMGVAFARVGSGSAGEPSPLVTPHSADSTTGDWNARARRLDNAVTILKVKDGNVAELVFDRPGATITCRRVQGQWAVVDRDDHGLPVVPVVRLANRPRESRREGRSEITRAVRYYCDAAVRTMLGMEGNREFYSIPQLALLNRGLDAFVDANGVQTSPWRVLAGHVIAMPPDERGDPAQIQQLSVGSPDPFIAQSREWARMLSAEAGIPSDYLGIHTDNPSSADAIRALESRLVKRVERRQTSFGLAWLEVGYLALLIRDGDVRPDYWSIMDAGNWLPAATPTKAATADAGMKQLAAVPWLADTDVGLELLGLDDQQILRAKADRKRAQGRAVLTQLAGPADTADAVSG